VPAASAFLHFSLLSPGFLCLIRRLIFRFFSLALPSLSHPVRNVAFSSHTTDPGRFRAWLQLAPVRLHLAVRCSTKLFVPAPRDLFHRRGAGAAPPVAGRCGGTDIWPRAGELSAGYRRLCCLWNTRGAARGRPLGDRGVRGAGRAAGVWRRTGCSCVASGRGSAGRWMSARSGSASPVIDPAGLLATPLLTLAWTCDACLPGRSAGL